MQKYQYGWFLWSLFVLTPLLFSESLNILCTTFPVYLFTQNITQETPCKVELLVSPQLGCPHNYSLTPKDMRRIARADILVMNGLGMEEFLNESLIKINPNIKKIVSTNGILEQEHIHIQHALSHECQGCEQQEQIAEKENDHHECNHVGEHHHTTDPHLFTNPRLTILMVQNITKELGLYDPEHASQYQQNSVRYIAELQKLCDETNHIASKIQYRKIVTQHYAWSYLAKDLKIEIVGVVQSLPGLEPSANQMRKLIQQIRSHQVQVIFVEPQYSANISQRIAQETGITVDILDPVVTGPQTPPLDYYQTIMQANLATLKKHLGYEP